MRAQRRQRSKALCGITLDTSALIALERNERRMRAVFDVALRTRTLITVSTVVLVEWWRGQHGPLTRTFDSVCIEPLDLMLAKAAGEALGVVKAGPSLTDAVVVASAARRGDAVYTSNTKHLQQLRDTVFPAARIVAL